MSESPSVSPEVGTKLLFENDRVRVWDLRLAPGEAIGLHRHTNDYVTVAIGGGKMQGFNPDGSPRPPQLRADGHVSFLPVDGEEIHGATNIGETPWRNIVVELKR